MILKEVVNLKLPTEDASQASQTRKIQKSMELMVANSFVRFKGVMGDETAIKIRDPAPMTEGTNVRAEVSLLLEQWKTLRQRGHEGPATEWYVFDGKGIMKLERLLKGVHKQNAEQGDHGGSGSRTPKLLALLEIVLVVPCLLHVIQNSFRWCTGVNTELNGKELLANCHNAFESLRSVGLGMGNTI